MTHHEKSRDVYTEIVGLVEDYRKAAAQAPIWPERCRKWYFIQMDRCAGALDVLYRLFPGSQAWIDTNWQKPRKDRIF